MHEPVADLSAFLAPRSVAIIGASADRAKIGARPLQVLRKYGFDGAIYPVNPRGGTIDELACFTDVVSIPGSVDCAIIVTAGSHVFSALQQCADKGVRGAVVISAGFAETGPEGRDAQSRMRALTAGGMRILGPNNQGTVNLLTSTVIGFNPLLDVVDDFRSGSIGLVSQSSGIGFGLLGLGLERGLGFSHLITTGNEADLGFADCALALLERDDVRVVAGALEGVKSRAALERLAARSNALGKPVIVLKGATSVTGGRAAVSHTGALSGRGAVFSAFCRQHGLIEAADFDALLDIAQAFSGASPPRPGGRVAVVTGTGGTAVLMADALEREGFALPSPSPDAMARLRASLPDIAVVAIPIDMTTANLGNRSLYLETARIVAGDPVFDTLVTVVGPATGEGGLDYARQIVVARSAAPNLFVSWTAPNGPGQKLLRESGIPVVPSPQRLARVMASARAFFAHQVSLEPLELPGKDARLRRAQAILDATRGYQLAEHAAKALCRLWNIPVTREALAVNAAEAVAAADRIGYPVALKLQSSDICHKTEVGGVLLGMAGAAAVSEGVARILEAARRHAPAAAVDGILVQEMVDGVGEAIVGVLADPSLGNAVLVGSGGVMAELVDDASFRVAPFNSYEAARLRHETRLGRMMSGVRGGPPWDANAFDALVTRIAMMAADLVGLVDEIDFNPVIIRAQGRGAVVADALVVKPRAGIHEGGASAEAPPTNSDSAWPQR